MKLLATLTAWLFVYPLFAGSGIQAPAGPGFSKTAHLYIVAAGVDDYKSLYNVRFHSAINDAQNLSDSLGAKFCRATGASAEKQVHIFNLLDKDATREKITATLQQIAREIKTDDVLFFSFSGDMRDFVPYSGQPLETSYLITYGPDSTQVRTEAGFKKHFFSLKELRSLLELMPNKYQMLLLDAGLNQKDIGWKFASVMLKDIPQEQKLSERSRVLIAPGGTSFECMYDDTKKMGFLSRTVIQYKNIFGLFFNREETKATLNEFSNEKGKSYSWMYTPNYCNVFFEDEILGYLRRFCICTPGGNTRGATMRNEEPDAVEKSAARQQRKDVAVIIATDTYMGTKDWDPLNTPKNDAIVMEKLMREKYGFETKLLYNISKDSLLYELKKLGKASVTDEDQLFLFFAGHGYYSPDNFDGCLVMQDSKNLDEDPNLQSYFQFAYLSNFVNRMPYKHIFVMLDVCFGGAFGGNNNKVVLKPQSTPSDISIIEYQRRKKDMQGRLYLASGEKKVGDVSQRDATHSPFADKILEKLNTSNETVVPQDLYLWCDKNNTPPVFRKLADHNDESEFFFTPKAK